MRSQEAYCSGLGIGDTVSLGVFCGQESLSLNGACGRKGHLQACRPEKARCPLSGPLDSPRDRAHSWAHLTGVWFLLCLETLLG